MVTLFTRHSIYDDSRTVLRDVITVFTRRDLNPFIIKETTRHEILFFYFFFIFYKTEQLHLFLNIKHLKAENFQIFKLVVIAVIALF